MHAFKYLISIALEMLCTGIARTIVELQTRDLSDEA